MAIQLDEVLQKLGSPGRLQVLSSFFLVFCFMHSITMNYLISFITIAPSHHCKLPNNWEWPKNISIPLHNTTSGLTRYDGCDVFINPLNHSLGTQKCPTGRYEFRYPDGERHSTITEWGLVCDNKYLVRIFQTSYFVGVMLGGTIGGFLADYYGRWRLWVIAVLGQAITGLALAFVSSYEISCFVIFLRGLFLQAQTTVCYTLIMELYPLCYRTKAGIVTLTMPALSLSYGNFIAYFIPEWRYQILAHSVTSVVTIIGFWFVQESFRWMLSNQQIKEAMRTAKTVAKFNAISLPKGLDSNLQEIADDIQATMKITKKQNVFDLMRHPFVRRTCLILCFNMFIAQICVYGFNFLINDIGGNIYINFIVISAVEVIMRGTSYFTLERLGRTKTTTMSLLIMGVMNLIFVVTKSYEGYYSSLGIVSLVVSMIGRIFNGIYFCAAVMQSQEIFPTTVRSTASGVLISTGRFGLLLLPIILLLGDYVWKQLPFLIFGVGSLIGGVLALMLPETRGRVMPNTVEEVSNLYQPRKKQAQPEMVENVPMLDQEEKKPEIPS